MKLTHEIRQSLNRAGIRERFHDKSLTDYGDLGRGYAKWVQERGPEIASEGRVVMFHGLGQADLMRMVGRAFHLNGAGVRFRSLSHLVSDLKRAERIEELDEAAILFISPAQGSRAGSPMTWWELDRVQDYIRSRIDRGQSVFLHWATDAEIDTDDPMNQWWAHDFILWVKQVGVFLRRDEIGAKGKASGGDA